MKLRKWFSRGSKVQRSPKVLAAAQSIARRKAERRAAAAPRLEKRQLEIRRLAAERRQIVEVA